MADTDAFRIAGADADAIASLEALRTRARQIVEGAPEGAPTLMSPSWSARGRPESSRASPVPELRAMGRSAAPAPRAVLLAVAGGALVVAMLTIWVLVRSRPDSTLPDVWSNSGSSTGASSGTVSSTGGGASGGGSASGNGGASASGSSSGPGDASASTSSSSSGGSSSGSRDAGRTAEAGASVDAGDAGLPVLDAGSSATDAATASLDAATAQAHDEEEPRPTSSYRPTSSEPLTASPYIAALLGGLVFAVALALGLGFLAGSLGSAPPPILDPETDSPLADLKTFARGYVERHRSTFKLAKVFVSGVALLLAATLMTAFVFAALDKTLWATFFGSGGIGTGVVYTLKWQPFDKIQEARRLADEAALLAMGVTMRMDTISRIAEPGEKQKLQWEAVLDFLDASRDKNRGTQPPAGGARKRAKKAKKT